MKNVKKLLALLLAMVMLFALCACTITVDEKDDDDDKKEGSSQSDKDDKDDNKGSSKLAGEWESDGVTMILNKNGSGEMYDDDFELDLEWEATSDEITIVMSYEDESEEITMEYYFDDGDLIFVDEDGIEEVWSKKGTASKEDKDEDIDYDDEDEDEYEDDFEFDYDSALVGDWESEGVEMTLYSDGTGVASVDGIDIDIEWASMDGAIALLIDGEEYYGEYSIRGSKLTIDYEDGSQEIWTKN